MLDVSFFLSEASSGHHALEAFVHHAHHTRARPGPPRRPPACGPGPPPVARPPYGAPGPGRTA